MKPNSPHRLRTFCAFISFFALNLFLQAQESDQDNQIWEMSQDPVALEKGRTVYKAICFSCHGHNLEGGTGFNLKDGEWIHGSNPTDILNSIKKGFPSKGMVPFESIYDEETLQSTVAYVLSKQEGFRELKYEIFHIEVGEDEVAPDLAELTPAKTGAIRSNLIDLSLPEVKQFAIRFTGTLFYPEAGEKVIKVDNQKGDLVYMSVDGVPAVERGRYPWHTAFVVPESGREISFTYFSVVDERKAFVELKGEEVNIPLSAQAMKRMVDTSIVVGGQEKTLGIRKKIKGLPAKSITVMTPIKTNYAFNPESCSIVGAWMGGGLNIGPNVTGRGGDGSERIGSWIFNSQTGIELLVNGKNARLEFVKFTVGEKPTFVSSNGKQTLTVSTESVGVNSIQFKYELEGIKGKRVSLKLPEFGTYRSDSGKIDNGILSINRENASAFSLTVSE